MRGPPATRTGARAGRLPTGNDRLRRPRAITEPGLAAALRAARAASGPVTRHELRRALAKPVQDRLGDLAPAVIDGQRVAPVGELTQVGDGG